MFHVICSMNMWNPFKKSQNSQNDDTAPRLNMLQNLAMKKLERMSPRERESLAKKFLTPENIDKNKPQIIAMMEQMKKTGQISDAQFEEGKRRLGL